MKTPTDAMLDAEATKLFGLDGPKTDINPVTGEPDIPDGIQKRAAAEAWKRVCKANQKLLKVILKGV